MEKAEDTLSLIQDIFGGSRMQPSQYSALALAYIGDSVYDLVIRTIVVDLGNRRVNELHRMTSNIVKAQSQAEMMSVLKPLLTEEERAAFRRGRNAKSSSSAKNASIIDYRIATGFEALIGYLYLSGNQKRAITLIQAGLKGTGQLPEK